MKRTEKIFRLTAQIRQRFARLENPIVRILAGISAISFLMIAARFAYVPFLVNDIQGNFVGFQYLSSFLYAFGVEFAMLCMGLIMYFSTNFMLEGAKVYFRSVSIVCISISLYFLCWVFFGAMSLSIYLEMLFSMITSLAMTWVILRLTHFLRDSYQRQRLIISDVLDDLIDSAPRYMSDNDLERYDEEVVWPRIKKVSDELNK